MKKYIFSTLALLLLMFSCDEKKSNEQKIEDQPEIVIEEILVSYQNCMPDPSKCTFAQIDYPVFTKPEKSTINKVVNEKIKILAADYISEDANTESIADIANAFVNDYDNFKKDFPEYGFGWYLKVNTELMLDGAKYISFVIDIETFTGGAHPNTNTQYYILDPATGRELEVSDIISDTIQFKNALETAFRNSKNIPEDQHFADAGYYINDGDFVLNDNIGITEDHIVVHYNSYEIGPYSLGSTTLELNKEDLKDMLR